MYFLTGAPLKVLTPGHLGPIKIRQLIICLEKMLEGVLISLTCVQGCLPTLPFLTAVPGFGASIVNAVGGGTCGINSCLNTSILFQQTRFLAGRSVVERLERVLLLRVAVDGESKDMEEVA